MSLRELDIKQSYRTLQDNITNDFFIPLLSQATVYKRSVAFFSSTAFALFSKGICRFVENGGKIQLVVSPYLSEDDIIAMKTGYEEKEKIIERALIRELKEPKDLFEEKRLNLLANLIIDGTLDIKVAFTKSGMYHEKLGIIEDSEGNVIAFSGSLNESANALQNNYEAIDVFCSWNDSDKRVENKKNDFEKIWQGCDSNLLVIDFPKLKEEITKRYKKYSSQFDIDEQDVYVIPEPEPLVLRDHGRDCNVPKFPDWLKLHDYQKDGIENWKKNNFVGIFDMATGTGKTITGLSALTILFEEKHPAKLFTIIVCPYQHLVEQWVEDIEKFNIKPIIGFSASSQKNWKTNLRNAVIDISLKKINKNFFCFISTNATFSSSFVQNQIAKIRVPKLLLVDEAHNFGASYLSKWLLDSYQYRIGLSATINRHGDEEGTKKLFDFFGEKVIEYDIERAIREKKLTPYKYYPVVVYLDAEELNEYKRLSKEIKNNQIVEKNGKHKLTEYGKILAMQRSRIIAGASSKIPTLKEKITPYKNKSHILVYCGATSNITETEDISKLEKTEERQIVTISKMLGNELEIKNHHFTSNENVHERNELKERFSNGDLQALVAIKCLDEGVNIPKIKTAFILASTTNPKEYIQRRGRVLRLAEGKDFAEIYDFITLPYSLNEVPSLTEIQVSEVESLVKRELLRAEEFARISMNWGEAEAVLDEIRLTYNVHESINKTKQLEVFDE